MAYRKMQSARIGNVLIAFCKKAWRQTSSAHQLGVRMILMQVARPDSRGDACRDSRDQLSEERISESLAVAIFVKKAEGSGFTSEPVIVTGTCVLA